MGEFYGQGMEIGYFTFIHILLARTQTHGHLTAREVGKCNIAEGLRRKGNSVSD